MLFTQVYQFLYFPPFDLCPQCTSVITRVRVCCVHLTPLPLRAPLGAPEVSALSPQTRSFRFRLCLRVATHSPSSSVAPPCCVGPSPQHRTPGPLSLRSGGMHMALCLGAAGLVFKGWSTSPGMSYFAELSSRCSVELMAVWSGGVLVCSVLRTFLSSIFIQVMLAL